MSVVPFPPVRTVRSLAAALALSSALALGSCATMSETNVHGMLVTDSMLAQIKPGTTQEQVVSAIGTPSTTSTINGEAFYYVSQTTTRPVAFMQPRVVDRRILVVYFDKGKVTRTANYGMQDGKVFDFVSRTTPTAGGELSFVTQLMRGLTMGLPGFN